MKISNNNNNNKTSSRKVIVPPIPLEHPDKKELKKGTFVMIELKSMPEQQNSQVYKREVPYFDQGTPEELLEWLSGLEAVMVGQNITSPEAKLQMACRLLKGDALRVFENFYHSLQKDNAQETSYAEAIQALSHPCFPSQSTQVAETIHVEIFTQTNGNDNKRICCSSATNE